MRKTHIKYKTSLDNLKNEKYTIIGKIEDVLNDPRGWKKCGYTFERKPDKTSDNEVDLIIKVVPNNIVKKICGFDGLSCADHGDPKLQLIYFNLEKWKNGCEKSKLSLDLYRTYVINHEIAHILDKHHLKLSDCKAGSLVPVRIPQTLGIGNCEPNPYPLAGKDY